jgi:hypothetical protein
VIRAVEEGYKNIVLGAGTNNARTQYKKFFELLLAQNSGALLYHCSAGKDRTGVATALLLSALGVDRETVIKDYLLSAHYVADKYYPVVPYVVKHTKESMTAGRTQAKQALGAIAAQQMTADQLKASLKPKIQAGVKDGVIAGVKASLVDNGIPLATANAMDESALNAALQSQPTIEQMVDGAIQSKGGLDAMAEAQFTQLQTIAAMTDAQIEQYAQNAGQKIAPLVTVKREYIEAMFAAIDAKYSSSAESNKVTAYLTDGTDGLGLTSTQIDSLKSKYLK